MKRKLRNFSEWVAVLKVFAWLRQEHQTGSVHLCTEAVRPTELWPNETNLRWLFSSSFFKWEEALRHKRRHRVKDEIPLSWWTRLRPAWPAIKPEGNGGQRGQIYDLFREQQQQLRWQNVRVHLQIYTSTHAARQCSSENRYRPWPLTYQWRRSNSLSPAETGVDSYDYDYGLYHQPKL